MMMSYSSFRRLTGGCVVLNVVGEKIPDRKSSSGGVFRDSTVVYHKDVSADKSVVRNRYSKATLVDTMSFLKCFRPSIS
jgi:hypothetical protein